MSIEDPSRDVVRAVRAGVEWFEKSAIEGIRVERKDGDTTVTEDRDAPAAWASFCEIATAIGLWHTHVNSSGNPP